MTTTQRDRRAAVLRRLGPGLITGAAGDDPAGIGAYAQVGARFRFGLVWTSVAVLPLGIAVQELSARLGLRTGKGLAALIREHFPRWVLAPAVVLLVAANTFSIGADLGAIVASIRLLVPVPAPVLLVGTTMLILLLQVFASYRRVSAILRLLTLSLLAYVVELLVLDVDWGEVARGMLPSGPFGREKIAALIAVAGATISPYLFFWQAAEEIEERKAHRRTGRPRATEVAAMRGDVVAGMAAGVAVMFAIIVASGSTLGPGGGAIATADEAARSLEPVAGSFAALLFTLGIVGTGLLAVPTLAGSAAYAVAEVFGWKEGMSRSLGKARAFYAVLAAAMLTGMSLNLIGVSPIDALYLASIANGLAAPPLLAIMAVLARRALPRDARPSALSVGLVWVTAALMAILPLWFLLAR